MDDRNHPSALFWQKASTRLQLAQQALAEAEAHGRQDEIESLRLAVSVLETHVAERTTPQPVGSLTLLSMG